MTLITYMYHAVRTFLSIYSSICLSIAILRNNIKWTFTEE